MNGDLAGGVAALRRRANVVRLTIFAFVAGYAGMLVGNLLEANGAIDLSAEYPDSLSGVFGLVYLAAFMIFIASVVVVSMWIHRAHANLFDAGVEGLDYTPGWSVGWFFIPFANLVMPYRAMRELWDESLGMAHDPSSPAPDNLAAWWGTWLGGNILSGIGARVTENGVLAGGTVSAVSTGLLILSALLLFRIVNEITRAQESGTLAAQAFA